jgi:hypothetical protein
MSALPPSSGHMRCKEGCPLIAISGQRVVSLDHLVGARKQRGRNGETKRLRGLEVEDKFEFGRLHNRKVRRFLTLEDAASVEPDLSVRVGETCSVAGQAARSDKQTARIDCWHRVAGRQSNQLITDADKEDTGEGERSRLERRLRAAIFLAAAAQAR